MLGILKLTNLYTCIIAKGGRWPMNKPELVKKFTKDFYNFCNAIDFQKV
jgi:hypothetical protein